MRIMSIIAAVVIGALAAWLWTVREQAPTGPPSHAESVVPEKSAAPEHAAVQAVRSEAAQSVASMSPRSTHASASGGDDDSTYDKMLSYAQVDPLSARTARDMVDKRQS